ncbi:LOG family protein [Nitrospina sp. 32_T5]|uniref:LOG family protein n=1 Tax=unclassified Nitrospina TaxID=2638683 RepID=UPI003F99DCA5
MPKNHYSVGDPKAEELIAQLQEFCTDPSLRDLFREMLTTVLKVGLEHQDRGDYKLMNTTLKELRHAFRVFEDYRDSRKAVIFGSARTSHSDPNYLMARDFAEQLADRGMMIITGAGGGIMEAANAGAGPDRSFGINIDLPFEQRANRHIHGDPKLMSFKYFFTRKLFFIKESDATVLFPGGFGTLDEGFENLTLFQTGKTEPRPIVLADAEDDTYWQRWEAYVQNELLDNGYISEADLSLFKIVKNVEEGVDYILDYYTVYHSFRYVNDVTVLRFIKPIPDSLVKDLNVEYKDILLRGEIQKSEALPEEVSAGEAPNLPRLTLNFNKHFFGRLNEMILQINRELKD